MIPLNKSIGLKSIRMNLKTGEFILRKSVVEFLVGRYYFVIVSSNEITETFCVDNILSMDILSNGEYVPISFCKVGK